MSPKPPKKKAKETAPVTWGNRPSKHAQAPSAAALPADSFVHGKEQVIRLNLNIPRSLHVRIKSGCALQSKNMKEVIMELLEAKFPPSSGV